MWFGASDRLGSMADLGGWGSLEEPSELMGKWRQSRALSPGTRLPMPHDLEVRGRPTQNRLVRFGSRSKRSPQQRLWSGSRRQTRGWASPWTMRGVWEFEVQAAGSWLGVGGGEDRHGRERDQEGLWGHFWGSGEGMIHRQGGWPLSPRLSPLPRGLETTEANSHSAQARA